MSSIAEQLFERGAIQGILEGIEEGRMEKRINLIRALFSEEEDYEKIVYILGYPLEEIMEIYQRVKTAREI